MTATLDSSHYAHHDHLPLVSCVMPTRGRPQFITHAISDYLLQSYPHRELIILDDRISPSLPSPPSLPSTPTHPTIRYFRSSHLPIGQKRNLANAHSRGDIIIHWDDDDRYSPSRISTQVSHLLSTQSYVSGMTRLLFRTPSGAYWIYDSTSPLDCPGVTLCYLRSYWMAHRFPPVGVGEERDFLVSAYSSNRLSVLPPSPSPLIIASIHPRNTSPRNTSLRPWRGISVSEQEEYERRFRLVFNPVETQPGGSGPGGGGVA